MKLTDAVKLYQRENRALMNAYSWWRGVAKRYKRVFFTPAFSIKVYKQGGALVVDDKQFHKSIMAHRKMVEKLKNVTKDYEAGIMHGKIGQLVELTWGCYTNYGTFRFEWSHMETNRNRNSGTWRCNKCNVAARTKHDKEECHLCRDWNGCGRDCTLSLVYCPKCKTKKEI